MTHWLRNYFTARLVRQPNQQRNARGFFEHCFFPEKVMRAKAVAVVARMHNDRVLVQAEPFQAAKNGADALIHESDKTCVSRAVPMPRQIWHDRGGHCCT